MRGESELSTRRSRVHRLQRQSVVFDVRRLLRLSMGHVQAIRMPARRVSEYVGSVTERAGG
jgi:hypothetical protein